VLFEQVWDRLQYYTMIDSIARAKRRHKARVVKMFGALDPYKNFELSGRYASGIDPRPDRPWEEFGEFHKPPSAAEAAAANLSSNNDSDG
jgi:hypothetical protein